MQIDDIVFQDILARMLDYEQLAFEAQAAVKKFLSTSKHDFCHESRKELAAAVGLADPGVLKVENINEFARECDNYQEKHYGVAPNREKIKRLEALLTECTLFHCECVGQLEWNKLVDKIRKELG